MVGGRIESFEQLTVWQEAQTLAVTIYKTTNHFPKDELFALTNQLRRAASSISANIAEGFGRETPKDKLHYYTMAYGSLLEVKNFIYLSHRLDYIDEPQLNDVLPQIVSCQKLINASKRSLKS
jgi:four helix bundle protein